ncbi:glycosyl transferase family 2 [Fluviicoccus keumensis]|uniref:Glycosyl transferase family 2 n=1 Tax=Fluviicoccus keumensis TaxID=1435465 RepID=A0A4Q7YDN2_9GAMM|nr:glycosyltransferase [Fluviicoccus keumensis]RZU35407.1 glycosyl transferase family 2 [Fluviicoccus keumensis]
MPTVDIVTATRETSQNFLEKTPLGQSLHRLRFDRRFRLFVQTQNTQALPTVYNARINAADAADHLAFIHDDVWVEDCFFIDRILEGLSANDVIGVAGNRIRRPLQPAWCFRDEALTPDTVDNLSGRVAHGEAPLGKVELFGKVPSPCELLDGLFLAAKRSVLVERQVFFDPVFRFHFYDMDFCRTARREGLRLSTWPISLTHRSKGAFGTPAWRQQYRQYLQKWKE